MKSQGNSTIGSAICRQQYKNTTNLLFFWSYVLLLLHYSTLSAANTGPALTSIVPREGGISKQLRVAVLGVHAEGNLGDEMETTPVLKRLHKWGALVHGYSHHWLPQERRLADHLSRPLQWLNEFFAHSPDFSTLADKYDAVLVAPGPAVPYFFETGSTKSSRNSNTNSSKKETGTLTGNNAEVWCSPGKTLAYVGVTLRGLKRWQPCLSLAAFREPESINLYQALGAGQAQNHSNPERVHSPLPVMLSGDFSHSFEPAWAAVRYWQRVYASLAMELFNGDPPVPSSPRGPRWCLLFSRGNAYGQSVTVATSPAPHNGSDVGSLALTAVVTPLGSATDEVLPVDSLLFATTSWFEDDAHMANLQRMGVPKRQLLVLRSVEQLWGLVSVAPVVYTDRYHPGVAAHRLGRPTVLLHYKREITKMQGLQRMVDNYTPDQVRALNEATFEALHARLFGA